MPDITEEAQSLKLDFTRLVKEAQSPRLISIETKYGLVCVGLGMLVNWWRATDITEEAARNAGFEPQLAPV